MTKAQIKRLVDAAIEAARKHGVAAVEVKGVRQPKAFVRLVYMNTMSAKATA
jgi:LDH2 family malate/lactate/ureidoglycolate dehydrogenase